MLSKAAIRTLTFSLVAGVTAAPALAQDAWSSEKAEGYLPPAEMAPASAKILAGGIHRVMQNARVQLSGSVTRENGKQLDIDPASGEAIVPTPRFYLPADWRWAGPAMSNIDSLSRPIVNERLGWSSWTQQDVDALRASIAQYAGIRPQASIGGQDTREADAVLGNFVGQALVRGIPCDDLVNIMDASVVNASVADSIIERIHAYEQARYEAAMTSPAMYQPTQYPANVVAFLEAHGWSLEEVLAIDPPAGSAGSRATPSGCYFRQPGNGLGLNLLSGANTIWEGDNTDDAQADVPIGFPFNFYQCQDSDLNTAVRVSSNGYLTFFQQGGGATNGVEYVNLPIANTASPNGLVAGWWDDLQVMPNQSNIVDKVSWKIEGTSGNRKLTVEYLSMSRRNGTTTDFHTFQIILAEYYDQVAGRCPIVLAYTGVASDWESDTIDDATIGMENFLGTSGECLETCDLLNNIPARNYIFVPMPNDTCANAKPLYDGYTLSGDLRFAYNDSNSCGNTNADQWYKFTAQCAGTLTVDTCGTHDFPFQDTGVDTVISASTSCPGGGGLILGCDDDGAVGCDQGTVRDSRLVLNLASPQIVYIRVTSFSPVGASGYYRIHADFDGSGAAPLNDSCANATAISAPQTATGNLLCATADGVDACDITNGNRDVWYRFVAPLGGSLRVTTCGTHDAPGIDLGMDTVLSIHTGCPGSSANAIACNDDSPLACDQSIQFDSRVIGHANANQALLIRLAPFATSVSDGAYQIHTTFLTADLNADCQVSLADLTILLSTFGQIGPNLIGDINGDGQVSLNDLTLMLSSFGTICP